MILRFLCFLVPLIVSFAITGISIGAEDADIRLKKAKEMAFIVKEQRVLDQSIRSFLEKMPENQRQQIKELLDKHLDQDAILSEIVKISAETFTIQEMDALINFYSTPLGHSILKKRQIANQKISEAITKNILESVKRSQKN